MIQPVDELKNRLKFALELREMKPIELSEITKIPKSAISQYMSGYAKPKQDRIYIIAKALNVNEAWLLGFDVQMERSGAPSIIETKFSSSYRYTVPADSPLKKAIDTFMQLNEDNQDIIIGEMKKMLKDQSSEHSN